MKLFSVYLFVTLVGFINALTLPNSTSFSNSTIFPAVKRSPVATSLEYIGLSDERLERRDGKKDKIKALKECLKLVSKFNLKQKGKGLLSKLKGSKGWLKKGKKGSSDSSVEKRDLVDDLLIRLFEILKDSGLVNSVVKMSLTDDEVRPAIIDITIELLKADVIPYEEIFEALKDSGLAVDVIKSVVTDPETRTGVIDLTKELIPALLKSGAIDIKDLLGNAFDGLCPGTSSTAVSSSADAPVRAATLTTLNTTVY